MQTPFTKSADQINKQLSSVYIPAKARLPRLVLRIGALSYLPTLRASSVQVAEIPSSAHFLFYDNPVDTFQAIGEFVHATYSNNSA